MRLDGLLGVEGTIARSPQSELISVCGDALEGLTFVCGGAAAVEAVL